jgi:hypothetical protein
MNSGFIPVHRHAGRHGMETWRDIMVSSRVMRFFSIFLLPVLAGAAIWPDSFGAYTRVAAKPGAPADVALWNEFGFQDAEEAVYAAGAGKMNARAYRFQDSTGAMAAFQWQRPAGATPSALGKLAAETSGGVMLAHGNYLLLFDGYKPQVSELAALFETLPKFENSALPGLIDQIPSAALVPNSGRYVIGPQGLSRFDPRVPPATAAFHMGTEAQSGVYRTPAGEMKLILFSFPTPQIARERVPEFQKIPGAMVKRSGPLLAVTVAPPDANEAERLLSQIRYEATVTWSEHVPSRRDNIGNLVINAFILIGFLLAFALVAGLAFGGVRAWWRRGGRGDEADALVVLHLSDRR